MAAPPDGPPSAHLFEVAKGDDGAAASSSSAAADRHKTGGPQGAPAGVAGAVADAKPSPGGAAEPTGEVGAGEGSAAADSPPAAPEDRVPDNRIRRQSAPTPPGLPPDYPAVEPDPAQGDGESPTGPEQVGFEI